MRIQSIVFLTLWGLLLGSCGTKKMNQSIAKYYPYHEDFTSDSTELVIVKPNEKLLSLTQTNYVKRVKNVFIPVVIFWYWNVLYKCELDVKQELEKLCSDIKADCYKYKLDSILPEQRLELTVQAIPTSFAYQDKGYIFVYLYGYIYKYSKVAFPMLKENLVVAYKLYSKNNLVREGTIVIDDKRIAMGDANSTAANTIDTYVVATRDHIYQAKKELITQIQEAIRQ
jgi:hypothetical protein